MINDVDLGALKKVVDDCLQRQETATSHFVNGAVFPKRYLVPITRDIHCSYIEFVVRLFATSVDFDAVHVLNRLLSDGLRQMDVLISTDDFEVATAHVNGEAGRIIDTQNGGKMIHVSD